jgi:hypothetical protein
MEEKNKAPKEGGIDNGAGGVNSGSEDNNLLATGNNNRGAKDLFDSNVRITDEPEAMAKEQRPSQTPDTDNAGERDYVAEFRAEGKQLENTYQAGMFILRTMNQCMVDAAAMPIPRDLYLPLPGLILEGEATLMGADTGIGKTACCVQIGDHVARKDVVVLYADMEMWDKLLQKRYSNDYVDNYKFPDNFYRICPAQPFNIPQGKKYGDYSIESIGEAIDKAGAKFVIIDNLPTLAPTDTDGKRCKTVYGQA